MYFFCYKILELVAQAVSTQLSQRLPVPPGRHSARSHRSGSHSTTWRVENWNELKRSKLLLGISWNVSTSGPNPSIPSLFLGGVMNWDPNVKSELRRATSCREFVFRKTWFDFRLLSTSGVFAATRNAQIVLSFAPLNWEKTAPGDPSPAGCLSPWFLETCHKM